MTASSCARCRMSGQNNAAITVQRLADGDWRLTKCAGVATISLEKTAFSTVLRDRSSRMTRFREMPRLSSSRTAAPAPALPSSINAPLPPENTMRALG